MSTASPSADLPADQRASKQLDKQSDVERGQALSELANAVVRIHKQFYGKGPTKARAHLSQDLVTVVLEGGFTRGEQSLQDHGRGEHVVQSRLAMQHALESEFRKAIESTLNRSVRSFMSANDPSNEMQAEVFVLEPLA